MVAVRGGTGRGVWRRSVVAVVVAAVGLVGAACAPMVGQPSPFDGIAGALIERRPFVPTDRNLFSPSLYGGVQHPPAAAPGMSDGAIRADLESFLAARFGPFSPRLGEARGLLDDPALVAKMPDLKLRAALVSLLGTAGEPVIASYRDDTTLTHVGFGFLASGAMAEAFLDGPGRQSIVVSEKFRWEHYLEFGGVLVHERLHSDGSIENSYEEELAARVIQTLLRFDVLVIRPELATTPTELTVFENDYVMARFNSAVGTRMRINESQGSMFPGALCDGCAALRTFYDVGGAEVTGNPSPGNVLLDQILARLAEPGSTWTTGGDFGDALEFLDHNHAGYGPYVQLAVANALKLQAPAS